MFKEQKSIELKASLNRLGSDIAMSAFALGFAVLTYKFLDPEFVLRGRYSFFNLLPHWLNAAIFGSIAGICLALTALGIGQKLARRTVAIVSNQKIEFIPLIGKRRVLSWKDIDTVRCSQFSWRSPWRGWFDVREIGREQKSPCYYSLHSNANGTGNVNIVLGANLFGMTNDALRKMLHRRLPDLVPGLDEAVELPRRKEERQAVVSARSWTG